MAKDNDWPKLSLSLPSSSSPPPSPPPSPLQYIELSRSPPPPPPPSPASPRPSPFQFFPLLPSLSPPLPQPQQFMYPPHHQEPYFSAPPPSPQPQQLMYPPHHQEQYFSAPPPSPPYMPSEEPNKLVLKCESPSQESNPVGEARATRRVRTSSSRASSSNPPRAVRRRREVNGETVPPPFPWATSKHAIIYSLDHLRSQGMTAITGAVICKHCQEQRDITFDLEEKFNEVAQFMEENKYDLHDRAPESWNHPVLPSCERCGTANSLKPVITKKRSINWLFLLLGQMIGCCKLEQLKYFCKHAMNHRTGAKDRLLYSVYLGLCKQLHPEGPYN